ncbi:hypothetical protein [Mycobacteroides abscessus]|uniref:hypothetical protein n=1 Tax=Mycobacteroides abscessus TaxID=36809 RepID=UPI000E69E02E|nr:hypothetical protein [Mycobacteroides abscessus]RIU41030.1 hypothetical protein D2E83_15215 [Mycobacteroides abscessus]
MNGVTHAAEAYLAAHPGDEAGAAAAGYIAALRVIRATDPHAIPVQSPDVRAAMAAVDIAAVEAWISANWNDIEEVA